MAGGINYTPGTYATNHVLTAAEFATEVTTALTNLMGPWTTYTPALTASGSNPVLGTGNTASGRWFRMGKTIIYEFDIVAGSTFTAGTGTYEVSLPVAALAGGVTLASHVGGGINIDASPLNTVPFECRLQSSTTVRMLYFGGTVGLSATTPTVPAASDRWQGSGCYEAA